MWDRLSLITPPASPAVTLADAKLHCRVDFTDDDTLITNLVAAATQYVEGPNGAGLCVMPQTWQLTLDGFPTVLTYIESQIYTIAGMNAGVRNAIQIPLGPVQSVTSLTYVDGAGTVQTLNPLNYLVETGREPARITPSYGNSWPMARVQHGAVKVQFVAGLTTPNPALLAAIKLLVGHWYASREAVVLDKKTEELPLGVRMILDQYARGRIA